MRGASSCLVLFGVLEALCSCVDPYSSGTPRLESDASGPPTPMDERADTPDFSAALDFTAARDLSAASDLRASADLSWGTDLSVPAPDLAQMDMARPLVNLYSFVFKDVPSDGCTYPTYPGQVEFRVGGVLVSGKIPAGSVVTATAIPIIGFKLSRWTGYCSGGTNPCTFTANTDSTVNAYFARDTYLKVVASNRKGSGLVWVRTSPGGTCQATTIGDSFCCSGLANGQTVQVLGGMPNVSSPHR